MFNVPDKYRLKEKEARSMAFLGEDFIKMAAMENAIGNNGYFLFPKTEGSKGKFFVVKALQKDGWNCIAVYVPSERRAPRYEEMFYLRRQFWGEDDVVFSFMTHESPFVAAPGWVHLWQPVDAHAMSLPPIFDEKFHFKKKGLATKLVHAVKKGLLGESRD